MSFKTGDWVTCIDATVSEWALTQGRHYKVTALTSYGNVTLEGVPWDWKTDRFLKDAQYSNLVEQNQELEGANLVNRNAIRLQRERAEKAEKELAELKSAKTSTEDKQFRMERALFLAGHYNWSRVGVTWEEAARDLFNYIMCGLDKPQLKWSDTLLPIFKRQSLSPFSAGIAKVPENKCPDKLEPKSCNYCCNGGCPDCLSRSKS